MEHLEEAAEVVANEPERVVVSVPLQEEAAVVPVEGMVLMMRVAEALPMVEVEVGVPVSLAEAVVQKCEKMASVSQVAGAASCRLEEADPLMTPRIAVWDHRGPSFLNSQSMGEMKVCWQRLVPMAGQEWRAQLQEAAEVPKS